MHTPSINNRTTTTKISYNDVKSKKISKNKLVEKNTTRDKIYSNNSSAENSTSKIKKKKFRNLVAPDFATQNSCAQRVTMRRSDTNMNKYNA